MKDIKDIINEARHDYDNDQYVIIHAIPGKNSEVYSYVKWVKLSQINDEKFLCKALFNTPWEDRDDWMESDSKDIIKQVKKRGDKEAIVYQGDAGFIVIFKANLATYL